MHRGTVGLTTIIAALALSIYAAPSSAASFDCHKGRSANEKIICADPELSAADDKLGELYKEAKRTAPNRAVFRKESDAQWEWREQNCHDKACLLTWYQARTRQLAELVEKQAAPKASATKGPAPTTVAMPVPVASASAAAHETHEAAHEAPHAAAKAAAPVPVPEKNAKPATAIKASSAAVVSAPASPSAAPQPTPRPPPLPVSATAAVTVPAPTKAVAKVTPMPKDNGPVLAYRSAMTQIVSAQQLYQDYQSNATAADTAYKGKPLKVTGTIRKITRDVATGTMLGFATSDKFDTVDARFAPSITGDLSQFHRGETVTVTCVGAGIDMGSPSLRCK